MVLEEICDLCSKVKRMNNKSALQDPFTSTGKPKFLPAVKCEVVPVNATKACEEVKVDMHILLKFCTDSRGE
jgi:hypothetical protein